MPVEYPDDFRRRTIELFRTGDHPVAKWPPFRHLRVVLRGWLRRVDIDGGRRGGVNTDQREEPVRLRRKLRTTQMNGHRPPRRRLLRQSGRCRAQNDPHLPLPGPARTCLSPPAVG